ncbi:MAG: alpha/beta hydrolase [Oscillospiraceae bacterium]
MIYKSFSFGKATAQGYFIENSPEIHLERKRHLAIICPGGGYEMTSDREAEPIALKYLSHDISCVVLRYSVSPNRFPDSLCELASCVAFFRKNHETYGINPNKICLIGGSAGGHLAASLGVFWHEKFLNDLLNTNSEDIKPNTLILSYPVISSAEYAHQGSFIALLGEDFQNKKEFLSLEKRVNEKTPRTFLWHTADDDYVPVENTFLFASALSKYKIPFEVHVYPTGIHGLATASYMTGNYPQINIPHCQDWIEKSIEFLKGKTSFEEDTLF